MRRFEDLVVNQNGQPVPGALVTVFLPGTQTPAVLYSDDGLTPIPNPVVTNSLASGNPGLFSFFVASGKYDFQVSGANIQTYVQRNVQIDDIFEFKVSDKQPWQTQTLEFSNQASGQTPPLGNVNLYTKLADKNLYYKDDTGREVGPLSGGAGGTPSAPVNSIQKNNNGVFGAANASDNGSTFSINEDSQFQGTNPWADVRSFGKFAVFSGTTAATVAGSPNVTLASAQNFKNGEYVTIYNAGSACGLATPGTPTVTPVVNGGGAFVVAANAGSLAFAYTVVAADKFGCYSPASTLGSTFTGNVLGVQTFTISTLTRSNNLVTANTTAPHGYVAGQLVHIKYFTTSDGTFEGFWIIDSVPTGTSFAFQQGLDTRFGASTAATGGTVLGFNANSITWTAVPGAWKYYIYGRTGGTFTLLGQTLLNSYVDYGSPMNDNQTFPPYIPTTSPVVGANDHLTAKINSGGGTSILTLSASAGVSASAPILSDDGPALVAAANASTAVYVPTQGITINSYTVTPGTRTYKLGGPIQTNATIEGGDGSTWDGVAFNSSGAASFGWGGAVNIAGGAYPQFVLGGSSNYSKLLFRCTSQNGCLNTADNGPNGGTQMSFDYVSFTTGDGGPTDYIGMNQLYRGGGFTFRYNKVMFATSSAGGNNETTIGNSPIPSVQFIPRGDRATTNNTYITSAWFLQRGSINVAAGPDGIGWFIAKDIEGQSCILPYFQFSRSQQFGSGVRGGVDLENLLGADRATAFVANYQAVGYQDIWIKKAVPGTGGRAILTGLPFSAITATGTGNLGHNTGVLFLGGNPGFTAVFTDGVIQASATGSAMPPPTTAPGVVVSAGGSVVIGTFPYTVQFLDINGNFGTISPQTLATTTSGNQTVTITRPAVPAGAVSWLPYLNGARIPCSGPIPVSTTSYVHTLGFQCGQSTQPPVALSNSIGSVGVGTTALSFWNSGFTSTTDFPNTLTANQTLHVPNATGTLALVNSASAGQVLQWNGTSAVGLTAPAGSTVYNTTASAAGASIGTIAMATAPVDQNYDFTAYVWQTNVTTGCSSQPLFNVNIIWTDAFTSTFQSAIVAMFSGAGQSFGAPAFSSGSPNMFTGTFTLRAKAGTAVSYSISYFAGTGCSTQANYAVAPNLTQQ